MAGAEAMKPQVVAFVDEEAGADVAEKVRRRLQHFIDRKIAALFEPLVALARDETLTGLARGFAFRMVEGLGILPRDGVADEVKALDQEARGALRKHGLRFGQYTIFLPALLKPAPTRLRLLLWSLANGVDEFPSSPPPGLVTIPNLADVPRDHYTLGGYHPAGTRAIRIDMLERLADLLRAKDSRAGFEATADMLSITGLTLEQFADLMGGLGYRGEKGERPKQRPEAAAAPATPEEPAAPPAETPPAPAETPEPAPAELPAPEPLPAEGPFEVPEAPAPEMAAAETAAAGPVETEPFYTFTWAPRPRRPEGARPRGEHRGPRGGSREGAEAAAQAPRPERGERPPRPQDGPRQDRHGTAEGGRPDRGPRPERGDRPDRGERGDRGPKKGGPPKGKGGKPEGKREDRPRSYEARPPREDRIDPDNPFAVLAALRDRK